MSDMEDKLYSWHQMSKMTKRMPCTSLMFVLSIKVSALERAVSNADVGFQQTWLNPFTRQ